ncbi:unnamed protein product [Brassica oleracea var. botrytis]
MKKALSLVVFMIFSIMLASVENKVNANVCSEGLGICNQCDERCKARHGPTGQGMCDRYNLCTCNYICAPVPPPPSPPSPRHTALAGQAFAILDVGTHFARFIFSFLNK